MDEDQKGRAGGVAAADETDMTSRIGLDKASDDELSDGDLDHVAGGQGTEAADSEEDELAM